jgi:hypothetical protein
MHNVRIDSLVTNLMLQNITFECVVSIIKAQKIEDCGVECANWWILNTIRPF